MNKKTKFIAEIGSNHMQNMIRVKDLIKASKDLGCWGVKFQLFDVDKLFRHREDREKNKDNELPREFIPAIAAYCKALDIKFGCTPFDHDAVDLLKPHVDFFKISSYELTRTPFIKFVYRTGIELILSSGILLESQLHLLVKEIHESDLNNLSSIDVLHCVADYPTRPEDCNLEIIRRYKDLFKHSSVGWSDHTREPGVIYQAIACGARIVEFHLDLEDGVGNESVHGHCWKPSEIGPVIKTAEVMNLSRGESIKVLTEGELANLGNRADRYDGKRPMEC